MSPRTSSKTLGLALPFGVVGLAAGWLSYGLLTIPVVDVVPHWAPLTNRLFMVAPVAALVGAALGAVLSRRMAARARRGATRGATLRTALELTALVVAGGTVTWGAASRPVMWRWVPGAMLLSGWLYALAFVPICALVIAVVRRAERARHGSLVAGADRRALWSILATVLASSTVRGPSGSATLDGPLTFAQRVLLSPRLGMVITGAAGLVVIALLLTDTVALLRVVRAAGAGFEACELPKATDADAVPSFDLGLGDDVYARVDRASHAYREPHRPTALLLGSVTAARAVLAWALLRGSICLAVTAAVLVGHRWAETPTAHLAVLEARCQRSTNDCRAKVDWFGYCHRSRAACYDAGALLLPAQGATNCPPPPHFDRPLLQDVRCGEALLRTGSEAGDRCCCEALEQSYRSRGADEGKLRLPEVCRLVSMGASPGERPP
jgi:hypothetical protein